MSADESMQPAPPILIVGIPRSGTTWQFNTLSRIPDVVPVFEPDNEALNPFAVYYKHGQHRFATPPTESNGKHQEQFWRIIFQGGWKYSLLYRIVKAAYLRDIRRIELTIESTADHIIRPNELIDYIEDLRMVKPVPGTWLLQKTDLCLRQDARGKRIIVKSVHCARQLMWIYKTFNPEIVIILRRLPNLIASYIRLRLNDSVRGIDASPPYSSGVEKLLRQTRSIEEQLFHKMIIQACELTRSLIDFQESVPQVRLIRHEEACLDPKEHFKNMFQQLSLPWTQEVDHQITLANRPGTGFTPIRDAAKEQDRYSEVLTKEQLDLIASYCQVYQLMELL